MASFSYSRAFTLGFAVMALFGSHVHATEPSECDLDDICREDWERGWDLEICTFATRDFPCSDTFVVDCEARKLEGSQNYSALENLNGTKVSQCSLFIDTNITVDVYNLTLVCHPETIRSCGHAYFDLLQANVNLVIVLFFVFSFCIICVILGYNRKYVSNNRITPFTAVPKK